MKQRIWVMALLMGTAMSISLPVFALKKLGQIQLADNGAPPPQGMGAPSGPIGNAGGMSVPGQANDQQTPPQDQSMNPSDDTSRQNPPDDQQNQNPPAMKPGSGSSTTGQADDGVFSDQGGNLKMNAPMDREPAGMGQPPMGQGQQQMPPATGSTPHDSTGVGPGMQGN